MRRRAETGAWFGAKQGWAQQQHTPVSAQFWTQLLLPSAHQATKPFPKILFSSLIFNQIIKHLNDLVHIQSTLQQHHTAAQEPAQPFPPSPSRHSLIILTAQQHQPSLVSFFSAGKKPANFLLSPKRAPSIPPTAIPSLQGCLQPRWWRVKL